MTYKKLNGLLLLIISSYFLVACGPTSKYYLTPPSTPEGQACIAQCKTKKLQCEQQAETQIVKCEREAKRYCQERTPCTNRPVCEFDANCKSEYFQCYRNCGGTVQHQQM